MTEIVKAKSRKERRDVYQFLFEVELRQRKRIQRDMFHLCTENRALGGTYWKKVLKRFGLKEEDIWEGKGKENA